MQYLPCLPVRWQATRAYREYCRKRRLARVAKILNQSGAPLRIKRLAAGQKGVRQ